MFRRVLVATVMLCALAPAAAATPRRRAGTLPGFTVRDSIAIPDCAKTPPLEELRQPNVIRAEGRVLSTKLDVVWVENKIVPVLIYNSQTGSVRCYDIPFNLRNYVDPTDGKPKFPGPTLEVWRAVKQPDLEVAGDRIRILLQNHAGPTDERCIWNGINADGTPGNCFLDRFGVSQCPKVLAKGTATSTPTLPFKFPQCCKDVIPPSGMNCFHGGGSTNLHFHGLHVSPQLPQDDIFLQVLPFGTLPGPTTTPMGDPGSVFLGEFQYDVDPLRSDQAEGTFWYHPHKHGSTAEQVGDGMAGALIVRGPLDVFLSRYYDNKLQERVLVLQEVHDLNFTSILPFPQTAGAAFMPLINGQLVPKITMYPGEVQRWRFIGATEDATAQLIIAFNGPTNQTRFDVRQIEMDGVPFSPNNYYCQPLLDATPCDRLLPNPTLRISPGNRADVLIKAPAKAGRYFISYDVFGAIGKQGRGGMSHAGKRQPAVTRELTRKILDVIAGGVNRQPALLAVDVSEAPCPPDRSCGKGFPREWPPLPEFLRPIHPNTPRQTIQFQVNVPPLLNTPPPGPDATFAVFVEGQGVMQFDESCAAFTEPLDRAGGQEWVLSQNLNNQGSPFHVFHIHSNPFQVVSTVINGKKVSYDGCPPQPNHPCVEPIWQDSLTIPDNQAGAGLPDTHPIGVAVIRQRFEDFTGKYVLHCHFLGHEDRGMMLAVQTVCPNGQWSETSATQQECTFGKFLPPAPPCNVGRHRRHDIR